MTRRNELFVGVDVAEARFDVAFRDSVGQPVRSDRSFPNTPDGIRDLNGAICACASLIGQKSRIIVGMEATSNFHKGLEKTLREARPRTIEVHVINPYAIKQFKKMHLKVYKTDKLDAHMIALYLAKIAPRPYPEPAPGQEELKQLTRLRRSFSEETTKFKNRLRSLLRVHFPGYKQRLGNTISKKMLVAFSLYGSPHEIAAVDIDELADARTAYRHKIGKVFADNLKLLVKDAPVQRLAPALALVITWTARRVLDLADQVKELDSQIAMMVEEYFPGNVLESVPGLGGVSIAAIFGEIGDPKRFDTVEQFIGYIGLYPIVWESGQTKARFKMTKKGNKLLKMTFLVASAAGRRFNPVIHELYYRLRKRGKSKKAAGGAIARKLAAIVFTLLKNGEKWNPEKALAGMMKSELMLTTGTDKKEKGNERPSEVVPQYVVNATIGAGSPCPLNQNISENNGICKR